jgi:Tfp pilus assembly protein PilX
MQMEDVMRQHNMRRRARRSERGAILVAVILIVVALSLTGALAIRQTTTEIQYASNTVKRERALMVAQAALDLAASHYKLKPRAELSDALGGVTQQNPDCTSACSNCIPDPATETFTGQRNAILAQRDIDCGGRPCMRQGAVAYLPDATATDQNWCDMPFSQLVQNGDPEAVVSVWVRNNASDALHLCADPHHENLSHGTPAYDIQNLCWMRDHDDRVVITSQATIRNTTVAIEQEIILQMAGGLKDWKMPSPDEGYGGGHNNDNTAVSVCEEGAVSVQVGP